MALTYTPPRQTSKLPEFKLPTVEGKIWSSSEIYSAPAKVVVFMCNHCPYVKAIEDRLIQLGTELKSLNVPMIGICSNDASEYPEDRPEELLKRYLQKSYSFIYLVDRNQTVAKSFGAVCTPDFFEYDQENTLVYRGRLDDSWKSPEKVTRQELKEAVMAILNGQKVNTEQIPSMGCSIKWSQSHE